MTDCAHGMPTPGACVNCMDDGVAFTGSVKFRPVNPDQFSPKICASHLSYCPSCNHPIQIGDPIILDGNYWVHAGCES